MEKLKPCPYCGSIAVIRTKTCEPAIPPSFDDSNCPTCGEWRRYYTYDYIVKCTNIQCHPYGLRTTELEAIKAWNTRR